MLLKFGKKAHLKALLSGKLRLTPAVVYQKKEAEAGKKGMGDKFDSYLKFQVSCAKMTADGFFAENYDSYWHIICQDCEKMPMICFYNFPAKHISELCISLNDFQRIREDFDNPDSVLIIEDEETFYKNIGDALGDNVFTSKVTYLRNNILNYDVDSILKIVDGFPSLTPFSPPLHDGTHFYSAKLTLDNKNQDFAINRTNSYLTVFFKHHYFEPQRELRIIMPKLISDVVVTKDISPIKGAFIQDFNFLKDFVK